MDYNSHVGDFSIKFVNKSNYKIWKTFLDSYLIGEYLWDVVGSNATIALGVVKSKFILKRSISHDHYKHIIGCQLVLKILVTLNILLEYDSTLVFEE